MIIKKDAGDCEAQQIHYDVLSGSMKIAAGRMLICIAEAANEPTMEELLASILKKYCKNYYVPNQVRRREESLVFLRAHWKPGDHQYLRKDSNRYPALIGSDGLAITTAGRSAYDFLVEHQEEEPWAKYFRASNSPNVAAPAVKDESDETDGSEETGHVPAHLPLHPKPVPQHSGTW